MKNKLIAFINKRMDMLDKEVKLMRKLLIELAGDDSPQPQSTKQNKNEGLPGDTNEKET